MCSICITLKIGILEIQNVTDFFGNVTYNIILQWLVESAGF